MHGETMIKNPVNQLRTEPDKKLFTAQAQRAHVRAYQSNGESMIAYCDKHHLALSTFKAWVTKYGEKKIPAAFVPMVMASKNGPVEIPDTQSLQRVEIQVGDIKMVFSEIANIETLIQFIRGLSHANTAKSTDNIIL
jgi:hypothetical protein